MPSVEDVRRTVRALVGVIQQAALGSSPVAESQVAHVRKVVRLLSLSHDQVKRLLRAALNEAWPLFRLALFPE